MGFRERLALTLCKDCIANGLVNDRPIVKAKRCATHHREFRKKQKKANHDRMVVKTYGLEPGEYDRLYAEQGGRCAICQHASGKVKRLAVDHDHVTGLVRGLCCGPCNQLIGYFRNSPETFRRAADYLERAAERNLANIGGAIDAKEAKE